eukprot:scaffold166_cov106-Skeletonema_dohrnii-CCMP3373.AAC.4
MRVIFLALLGMSVIKVAAGEELDTQCTGDNKVHCCKQIQNGESTAEEECASFDCGLDIECDDSDGDSWDEYHKEERDLGYKPSGGWNSKLVESFSHVMCVSHLHHHIYDLHSNQTAGPAGTANLVDGTANPADGASPAVAGTVDILHLSHARIQPTKKPTWAPHSDYPTVLITEPPTRNPTRDPTPNPTNPPTNPPTPVPTNPPTPEPSPHPTPHPTQKPSKHPTKEPTWMPSEKPVWSPPVWKAPAPAWNGWSKPTKRPVNAWNGWSKPTRRPVSAWNGWSKPTRRPVNSWNGWSKPAWNGNRWNSWGGGWGPKPTKKPTQPPVNAWDSSWSGKNPTDWVLNGWGGDAWTTNNAWGGDGWGPKKPTVAPTAGPTSGVTSSIPSKSPSDEPSKSPSDEPSTSPSDEPSTNPSEKPSIEPSLVPSSSSAPSQVPSISPSEKPSNEPSPVPSSSSAPSLKPTAVSNFSGNWQLATDSKIFKLYLKTSIDYVDEGGVIGSAEVDGGNCEDVVLETLLENRADVNFGGEFLILETSAADDTVVQVNLEGILYTLTSIAPFSCSTSE